MDVKGTLLILNKIHECLKYFLIASGEYNVVVSNRVLKKVFLADLLSVFLKLQDNLCAAEIVFVLICCKFRFSAERS